MPTDYPDEDSLVNYMDVCGKLNSLFSYNSVFHTVLEGDFNCLNGSRFDLDFIVISLKYLMIILQLLLTLITY